MLGGRGVFIHTPSDDQLMIEPQTGCGPVPVLKSSGYQAVSEGSFDFEGLRVSEGKQRKFYVVYDGVSQNVCANDKISTDTDAGESHVATVAAAARDDGSVRDFLRHDCVVYAVAV
jgi:hypothetical protein